MKVILYTDGSSRGNPGPGGYGAVLRCTDAAGALHERELSAGYARTTNNRMELMGVIAGLEALRRPCEVEVHSDSQYVVNAFNKHWVDGWRPPRLEERQEGAREEPRPVAAPARRHGAAQRELRVGAGPQRRCAQRALRRARRCRRDRSASHVARR